MNDPDQTFEAVAETARRLKVDRVGKHGADPDETRSDLQPVVLVMRDGDLVAYVAVSEGHPFAVRSAAYQTALMLRPHEVFVVSDSHMLRAAPSPSSASAIRAGEVSERWHAGERDGITEAMVVMRVPRVGEATFQVYPYRRTGTTIKWGEPTGADTLEGAVVDAIADGFKDSASYWEQAAEVLHLEGGEGVGRWRLVDRVSARMVSKYGLTVMLKEDGSTWVDGEEQPVHVP